MRNGGFGMKKRIITVQTIKSFEEHLLANEKALATTQKYMHDIRHFVEYTMNKPLEKQLIKQAWNNTTQYEALIP